MADSGAMALAGVDEVAWDLLSHAYGAATDVPDLLRALTDPDPAVRENALDAMYGAVHHQGDVYDSTVAVIPFLLRLVADRRRPGRAAVVELLAGIGGAGDTGPPTAEGARAGEAVGAAYPLWLELLSDHVPAVRAATCFALLACRDRATGAAAALRQRFEAEGDARTRTAIVGAVAELARRADDGAAAGSWLAGVLRDDPDPGVCVAALTQANTLAAHGGPPVAVETALTLLAERGAGAQRRRVDLGKQVLGLSRSMGDQVAARVDLLTALLRSPDRGCRMSALLPAGDLVEGWRADFVPLIALVAEQVTLGPAATRARAVRVLETMDVLAAPAADALVAALEGSARIVDESAMDRRSPWVVRWQSGGSGIGPALCALAGAGDPRALPMLAWALEAEVLPRNVGEYVGRFGARAADLAPLIVRRWRDLRP
ncbi:hypothetical protein AB0F10_06545, partial [Actinoplanes sp. NPDC026623]